MLNILDSIPERFLGVQVSELYKVLSGPTLIHLPGRHKERLFVSVLLHGNETTGFIAMQSLLKKYAGRELPRAMSIFVGNVDAAKHCHRRLEGQPDYNRIWKHENSAEHNMAMQVMDIMRELGVFISVDVHNNTGLNPHYACVNRLDNSFFQIATLFSRRVVYFIRPEGVQSMAFSDICPSVTVECGQPGHTHGTEHVMEYLDGCMHLSKIPSAPVHKQDIDLLNSVAMMKVPENVSFGFGAEDADICFDDNIDSMNFKMLPAGTMFAKVKPGNDINVKVFDTFGSDITNGVFTVKNGILYTNIEMMPSMLTMDKEAIRKDCLGYVLEPLPIPPDSLQASQKL